MKTIKIKEKDFKDEIYCGGEDLSNIEGNLEIENLASRFHQVYQEELRRQDKKTFES